MQNNLIILYKQILLDICEYIKSNSNELDYDNIFDLLQGISSSNDLEYLRDSEPGDVKSDVIDSIIVSINESLLYLSKDSESLDGRRLLHFAQCELENIN